MTTDLLIVLRDALELAIEHQSRESVIDAIASLEEHA